jgi:dienelactone hydrolase
VRFAIGHNADLELEVHHRSGHGERWQRIARLPFAAGGLNPMGFSADGRYVVVADTRAPERDGVPDTIAMRLLDSETGKMSLLFQHPDVDVDQVLIAPGGHVAFGVRYVPDRPRYRLFADDGERLADESGYAEVFRLAMARFPGAFLELTSITRDRRLAVLRVETSRNPGTLHLIDVERRTITQMLASRRWLDPEELAPVEPVSFEARDGVRLHGFLTRPNDARADLPVPLVVMPHGGPHFVRDDGRFDEPVQLLAHHGYAVLQVNFRGSGGYGRRFQEAGYGEWGGRVLDDIEDGVRWAVTAGHADPNRVCAVGFSFGAYAAAMGAVRYPDRYRCVVGVAGVYDLELLRDDVRTGQPAVDAFLDVVVGADHDRVAAASPAHQAGRLRAPVLLIHGTEDLRAPVEQARRMRAALAATSDAADRPETDYLEIAREGHGFYALENRVLGYERMLAFLETHLGAAADAQPADPVPHAGAAGARDGLAAPAIR